MLNRNHVPLAILPKEANGREIGPSMSAFKDNLTMASWHPKRSEHVLLEIFLSGLRKLFKKV